MSEGFAYLDILFFALVAAFIAFRLRSVLGRKTGQERRRPTVVASPRTAEARAEFRAEPARGETVPPPGPLGDEPAVADPADPALKAGLTQLRLADPNFDLGSFLDGSKAAFAMIVEAFAKGDQATLKPLLAPEVHASFAAAIDARTAEGRTLTTEIVAVQSAALAGATVRNGIARVTVRFTTEQINVTRDASGEVVEGDPSAILEVVDLWSFERDTRSRDPNWSLVETRSPEN